MSITLNIQRIISNRVKQAMIFAGANVDCRPKIHQSTKMQFGDYQVNGVMTVAKTLAIPPKKFAENIQSHLDLTGIAAKTEIVNPGFINIFLDPIFLAENIEIALRSKDLNINRPPSQIIVIDYSSPNIAKEMHVGHLRSTIIGDAVVRTMELLGHKVIRANHIGDWGTQLGMLIAWLENQKQEKTDEVTLKDLESCYRKARQQFDQDKIFVKDVYNCVVKLQNGDEYFLKLWRKLVDITVSKNQIIYDRLNVSLKREDIMGESIYNTMLPGIVSDLKSKGLATESEGAIVVFLDEFKNKKGEQMGVIIQKKDGGYLYNITDIACVKYRYENFRADRILYYVDSRQHQHLTQVWTIARKAGYVPDSVLLEHHMFGMMMDKNGKPFKTRVGDAIKLSDFLDEALERARHLVVKKNPNLKADELEKLANIIGIGSLKYADLSKNRTTNYIFDWNNMLSFEGNTAPYIQYAYARILSIFRKSGIDERSLFETQTILSENREVRLATCLLQFEETIEVVARDGTPHVVCSYLYNLTGLFSSFYENCPILTAINDTIRHSRLKLALLTAKTLKLGLNILGIETIERM